MKNDDLFEIIGDISDRHIEGAKKKKASGVWKKWGALAACLCIVVAAAFMITLRVPGDKNYEDNSGEPDYREDDYLVDNGTSNFGASETSDKYTSLNELLEFLSENDDHGDTMDSNGSRNISADGNSITYGAKVVAHNGYVYRIGDGCVEVLNLDGETLGTIDFAAHEIFISGDRLALVGGRTVGNEFEYESYSIVRTYMLRDPANPEFLEKYEQSGERVACYMANDKLYLLTTDGVCACGYSRLDDVSEYIPTFDGEPWNQNDIAILGEPTRVNYLAVSAVEMTGGISAMKAFYGDIDDVFYGEDWIAVATRNWNTQPEVYVFDESFKFTGKIELADIIGVDKSIKHDEDGITIGDVISVTSVSKYGEVFGVLGGYSYATPDDTSFSGYSYISRVMIAAKNMETGETDLELVDAEADTSSIDDIFHEDDRAIICISTMYNSDDPQNMSDGNRFVVAEFENGEVTAHLADFITDRVNGVENYFTYGSPYGDLETIIPMEDAVYLRFNGKPNGFDIFDFSDIGNTKMIYKSNGELPEREYFDFTWQKLDEKTIAVLHIKMSEDYKIRDSEYSLRIYSVDITSDTPFTWLAEYTFGETEAVWVYELGLAMFEYEGEYYFVSASTDGVTKIKF